jgi:hypothetical protein
MIWITPLTVSGTNRHAHLIADDPRELERMSKRLHEPVHSKGNQQPHLDLPERKIARAVQMGALNDPGRPNPTASGGGPRPFQKSLPPRRNGQ